MKHSDLKIGMKVKRVKTFDSDYYPSARGNISTVSKISSESFQVLESIYDWEAEYFEPVIEEQEKSITINKDKQYKTRCGYPARILCTDFKKNNTPILSAVEYKDGTEYVIAYTQEGICPKDSDFNLIEVTPYSDFKKNDKVMVSDDGKKWKERYFAYEGHGHAYCYIDGATSWSNPPEYLPRNWKYCRKPTQEELEGD